MPAPAQAALTDERHVGYPDGRRRLRIAAGRAARAAAAAAAGRHAKGTGGAQDDGARARLVVHDAADTTRGRMSEQVGRV